MKIVITPGQTHDIKAAAELLTDIRSGQTVLADRAYDADWLRALVAGLTSHLSATGVILSVSHPGYTASAT